jgi:hypothetical protein
MAPGQTAVLQLPSYLHGTFRSVQQKARREGLRCGEQYREEKTFPVPRRTVEVPPGEVVFAHDVVDFQHERPAWRLYMVSNVVDGLLDAVDGQSTLSTRDAYEAVFLETAWGALYFALAQMGPVSAERTAKRLQAVLRFWESLQCARYLFKKQGAAHTLEELVLASYGWAVDAWCPVGDAPGRERLAMAAERMERATREDCIEAIFREMPRVLSHVGKLKHWNVVTDPGFQRERLSILDSRYFERVSGARPGDLIWLLTNWDHELDMQ